MICSVRYRIRIIGCLRFPYKLLHLHMRYFLCLSYDGAAFCGWQIQPSSPSVQACLEETLSRLLNRPVAVTGAGRTDTGVHAVNYVAHFDSFGSPLAFRVCGAVIAVRKEDAQEIEVEYHER